MDPVTAIAALGSMWLSSRANRAMKKAMEQFMAFARQGIGVLSPFVGRESPILAGQHRLGLQDIGRTEQGALARSRGYAGRTGAPHLGRDLRIEFAATRERNRANLGYAGAQENLLGQRRSELASLLTNLSGAMGQGFTGIAQAQGDTAADWATLLGQFAGGWKPKKAATSSWKTGGSAGK